MLDGAIDGLRVLRGRDGGPARRNRSPIGSAAATCSTRRAPPGGPRASGPTCPTEPLGTSRQRRRAASHLLFGGTADTVYLSPAPLYHAAPLRFCMAIHAPRRHRRGHGALRRRAGAGAASSATRSPTASWCRRCSCACSSCPTRCAPRYDVSSLQVAIHAAAPCPVAVKQPMIEWWGPIAPRVLRRHRGQRLRLHATARRGWPTRARSASALGSARSTSSTTTATSCRRASPARSTSRAAPASSTTTTPTRRRRPATAQGWSTLGDVGYLDDDGYLYLTDRKAFMIISGGVNIYPQEAENVLVTHPAVRRRRRDRRAQRGLRRGGQGGRAAGHDAGRRRRRGRAASAS